MGFSIDLQTFPAWVGWYQLKQEGCVPPVYTDANPKYKQKKV